MVQLNPVTSTGSSLLDLIVNQQTPVGEHNLTILLSAAIYYQYYNIFYQAVDRIKNTPLNIIISYKKIVSDFLTLHAIIMGLLESGEVQLLAVAHH